MRTGNTYFVLGFNVGFYIKRSYLKRVIQGADDKLGQFLAQDIEASASHRNFLQHSLKSCSSLVSPYVNKPLISTKMSRYSAKLVRQS